VRVLMSGASGFLGTRLASTLTAAGHEVHHLVRREPRAAGESRWDPARGEVDAAEIEAADAVVNLSGVTGFRRWTPSFKQEMRASRLGPTTTLATAIAAAGRKPSVLVNASGVHYYAGAQPDDAVLDEQSPAGTGFLTELCKEWEAATAPAADAGVRVVYLRTGLPLDRDGGFLRPMSLLFRLGLGGKLAGGDAYMPWISMPDWLGATRFVIERADVSGPVNLTGPEPVTNAEFTRTFGHLVHRPALIPVPRFGMELVFGEFAEVALASLRVIPATLTTAGYRFQHADMASALRWGMKHRD
jgi:uncharacterized protein (TIGR01777 family)